MPRTGTEFDHPGASPSSSQEGSDPKAAPSWEYDFQAVLGAKHHAHDLAEGLLLSYWDDNERVAHMQRAREAFGRLSAELAKMERGPMNAPLTIRAKAPVEEVLVTSSCPIWAGLMGHDGPTVDNHEELRVTQYSSGAWFSIGDQNSEVQLCEHAAKHMAIEILKWLERRAA
jgi:hypothetical protein